MLDSTPPKGRKMKYALEAARSLGIDTPSMEKADERRLCFEAALVMVLSYRPEAAEIKYSSVSELCESYPEFLDVDHIEQVKLLNFRNFMAISLLLLPPNHNRSHLMDVVTRITEGRNVKYVTGSGAAVTTRRRVLIYQREGGVVPTVRPPRKSQATSIAQPESSTSERKEDHDNQLNYTSSELRQEFRSTGDRPKVGVSGVSRLVPTPLVHMPVLAVQPPLQNYPVPGPLFSPFPHIIPFDSSRENEFYAWLSVVWEVGVSAESYGWGGTFLTAPCVKPETDYANRAAMAFAKALELYFHIIVLAGYDPGEGRDGVGMGQSSSSAPISATTYYPTVPLTEGRRLYDLFMCTTTVVDSAIHREHLLAMGLYFGVRRCMSLDQIQYFGDVSASISGNVCVEYAQAVEVYFSLVSKPSPRADSALLLRAQSCMMEIFFRLSSALQLGVVRFVDTSWGSLRDQLFTDFVVMSSFRGMYMTNPDEALGED
eukprot:CAMPEP_0185035384 /NCGR_PEP_ID=MMETSP1103-20130426/26616_1 /TAXON_ID=36769 /ORGANISM="Paraphysomonas bandaiensis, Strain Caron Lab Isolate" /LENGTH=485 /DNA_ID=CAMNT_0027572427 /DNA_START=232 /DNA_END=1689 /DNA_ORIENTATION=-